MRPVLSLSIAQSVSTCGPGFPWGRGRAQPDAVVEAVRARERRAAGPHGSVQSAGVLGRPLGSRFPRPVHWRGCGEWGERPIGGARAAAPADGADSTRADAPAVDGAPASNPADGAADAGGAGGTRDDRAVAADGDQTTAPDAGASAASPPADDQAGSAPASPPDGAPATAGLPKGFMEASSPSAGLTIGLPSGWGDLASYPETDLIPLAEDLGIDDTALLRTRIGSFEVFKTAAPSSGVPFAPRVYIDMESHPGAPTSPPASFYDGLSGQRVTIDHNELVGTVNGQGTIGYFSDAPLGGADHGALLHLPNSEGEFVNVVLFTSSEGEALELAHLIAFSAH